jgi:hypothetical protein
MACCPVNGRICPILITPAAGTVEVPAGVVLVVGLAVAEVDGAAELEAGGADEAGADDEAGAFVVAEVEGEEEAQLIKVKLLTRIIASINVIKAFFMVPSL